MKSEIGLPAVMLLFVMLTTAAAAQEVVRQGCRRGTPRALHAQVLRRGAAGGQQKQAGGDFYVGERHQLVVMVAFSDLSFADDEAETLSKWNNIFNARDYSEPPFCGSVYDYFYAQSDGRLQLSFDLHYIQLQDSRKRYASTSQDDENSQYLVADIVAELLTRDIDWSRYDWNGDGFVNQLLIIYPGKGMNDGGGKNSIWPHQWWMSEHLLDGQSEVYCDPISLGDYKVDSYCAVAEQSRTGQVPFGTLCHEYTHCFGMPDFYFSSTQYVGQWDLMDNGNYNGNGFCPPNYSAHERWLMGWLTPCELTVTTTVSDMPSLSAVGSDAPQAYLIRNDGYSDEYYIVENRQRVGWDSSLPGSGIVVFHVDYEEALWCGTGEQPNHPAYMVGDQTYNAREGYVIFPANNMYYLNSGWAYPYGSRNELTDTTLPASILWHPNSEGTLLMSKPLTQMAVSSDGLASFQFTCTPTAIDAVSLSDTSSVTAGSRLLYRIGPVSIVRLPNGKVKKVVKP